MLGAAPCKARTDGKLPEEGKRKMLHIYGATDRGMVRETNEDRFAGEVFDQGSGYAVVCDGMGGEVGGGIAAGIAAEEVRRMIESSLRSHMEERSLRLLLETAIAGANRAVYTRSGQSGGALTGMGSTLCAAVISDVVEKIRSFSFFKSRYSLRMVFTVQSSLSCKMRFTVSLAFCQAAVNSLRYCTPSGVRR